MFEKLCVCLALEKFGAPASSVSLSAGEQTRGMQNKIAGK